MGRLRYGNSRRHEHGCDPDHGQYQFGIAESTISRFMAGSGLSMEYLDALAKLLDLHLTLAKRPKKKG